MVSITFCVECILLFGSRSKVVKVNAAANTIEESASVESGEQKKSHSQIHNEKDKKKTEVQVEMIEQPKLEIEQLKAA